MSGRDAASAPASSRPSRPSRDAQTVGAHPSDVHVAAGVARAFVEDYVCHRSGRLAASRIRGAAPGFRQALDCETAESPWPVRRRQARIAELHTHLDGPRARACARVTDGHAAVIRVAVSLECRDGAWEVFDVGER